MLDAYIYEFKSVTKNCPFESGAINKLIPLFTACDFFLFLSVPANVAILFYNWLLYLVAKNLLSATFAHRFLLIEVLYFLELLNLILHIFF